MTKQNKEEFVKKMLEPTIDNAIRDMKISRLLFLTKDNKFFSSIADEYMEDKKRFLPFIKEEKREQFFEEYSNIFQDVEIQDDTHIAWRLLNWEHTGKIMMLLSENTDWDAVDKEIHLQGHSGHTMSCLTSKVVYFSPYGLDFVEHVWGIEKRIKAEKEIASAKTSTS